MGSDFSSVAPDAVADSLAINPKSPNIVYAYVGNNYMCIIGSTTYGYGNWTTITDDLYAAPVPNLLIDPENVGRMYAASPPDGYPIQISDDTGVTWTPSYSGITTDQAATYLVMHPTQHNILYAGAAASFTNLREITMPIFLQYFKSLPAVIARRCHYVISENERVLQAVEALQKNDLKTFGLLLNQSHKSLRENYEVSCPEVDCLVDSAQNFPACLGSRVTGAEIRVNCDKK